MILQDAVRAFMRLSIEESCKKSITRPDGCSGHLKVGVSITQEDSGPVLFDADSDIERIKQGYYWCTLRIDEVLADDWEIVDDN